MINALTPVLQDIRASRVPEPEIVDVDWLGDKQYLAVELKGADGTTSSVCLRKADRPPFKIVEMADQVQEWVIMQLWACAPTNWPRCPAHPTTHPMTPTVVGKSATWVCPADWQPFATVGSLADEPWATHDGRALPYGVS